MRDPIIKNLFPTLLDNHVTFIFVDLLIKCIGNFKKIKFVTIQPGLNDINSHCS